MNFGILLEDGVATEYQVESKVIDTGLFYNFDFGLDGAGNAHIVYNENRADRLFYINNVGNIWNSRQLIHTTSDVGDTAVSIGVEPSGIVHVAYDSGMGGNDVFTYATNTSGSWSSTVVRTTSRWYSLSLYQNRSGMPGVAYYYDYSGLNFAVKDSSGWTHVNVDSSGSITRFTGRFPDLVIDSNDHGHIVYYDFNSNSLRYASNASGTWQYETLVSGGSPFGNIAKDQYDNVYIGYLLGGQIRLCWKDGGSWERVNVTPAGSYDEHFDFDIAKNGAIYFVYNDKATGNLKIATDKDGSFMSYDIYDTNSPSVYPVIHMDANTANIVLWDYSARERLIYLEVVFKPVNTAPVACIAGGDQIVEADSNCEARVVLDGSCSSDEDSTPGTNDDINDFNWYEISDPCDPNSDILLGSGEVIECNLPLGEHTILLEVTDTAGAFDSNEITITVEDITPPQFTLSVEPNILWPPNNKMVQITPNWLVSDNCDEDVEVSLVDITIEDTGNTGDDIFVDPNDGSIYLRAERSGKGVGRIYTITYQAVDDSNNVTIDSATVVVPHDQR